MKKLLLFLVLAGCAKESPYTYTFTIAAMFKNEAKWLSEWIDYHANVLGAEHFYLYNNDSTDAYKEALAPYLESGLVELIEWSSKDPSHKIEDPSSDAPWCSTQIGAYNDCLRTKALGKAKWVAMIDIDEFIVPTHGVQSFYKLLKTAEKNRKGTVKLLWKMFGTSHVESLKPGERLIEKLTLRASDNHVAHRERKSLYRPEAVQFCLIHETHQLNEGFGAMMAKPELFRIHHYWTRTEEELRRKRRASSCEELNVVEDTTILQYLDR
jgi:hypothetical protein